MQETPQHYIQRILGHAEGKDPLKVQRETPKSLERNLGVPLRIAQRFGPDVLIEGLQRHPVVAEDEAHAPAADQFSISQMGENLSDRPLVRFRPLG